MSNQHQQGVTLVELLVSITLGLLITGAVVQSYLSTRQTSKITNGISRVQENARFGHYFLTKDLRQAGDRGCVAGVRNMLSVHPPTGYLDFDSPVSGWEFSGTKNGDTYTTPTNLTTPSSGSWSGSGSVPSFLMGDAIAGSDILMFKSLNKLDIILKDANNTSTNSLATEGPHGLADGAFVMVGDCAGADFFQHSSSGNSDDSMGASQAGNNTPGNDNLGSNVWQKVHGPQSSVYSLNSVYYFIQEGTSGLPSLFRLQSTLTPPDESLKEELVEGVESLQLYFGEDTTDDNNPNQYLSADDVTDWEKIVSVRVGLLFRSANNALDIDQASDYTLLDNIKIAHSDTDKVLRYSVNSTVKLRNRGLSANTGSLVCDAGIC